MDLNTLPDTPIGIAGDWHGNFNYAKRALTGLARKHNVEVVLHVGDFGVWGDGYVDSLGEIAKNLDLHVLFVDGNHENFDWLYAQPIDDDGVRRLNERIWHLPRGFRWEWSGMTFLALGGAVSIDKDSRIEGVSWWPQEEITASDMVRAVEGGPVDVMITHDCPDRVDIPAIPKNGLHPDMQDKVDSHRRNLGRVVDEVRPKHLFHGHFHRNYQRIREDCYIRGLDCDGEEFADNLLVCTIDELDKRKRPEVE